MEKVVTFDGQSAASTGAERYKSLIYQFINHDISAADFQSRYLQMFKQDDDIELGGQFDILEYLFTSADGYVADPEARSYLRAKFPNFRKAGQGLDEQDLLTEARDAYRQLFGE